MTAAVIITWIISTVSLKENLNKFAMTMRYSHLSTAHKQNAVKKLDVCTEKKKEVGMLMNISKG